MKDLIRTIPVRASLLALLAFSAACGNRDDATGPLGTGNLVLTLTTRDGVTPSIVVTGPDGYSRTVGSSMTLAHLAAGSYTITADSIVTPGALVGYSVDTAVITGSPIVVSETGSSSASVSYAFARTHGVMWVASSYGPHVSGLAPSQLDSSAVVGAADSIGGLPNTLGVAIDANGNMWVNQRKSSTLRMYTVAQRQANVTATPARTLTSEALSGYRGQINFDSHGNLWVADYQNGLVGFSAAQLAAGGSVQPAVILTDTTRGFAGPQSIVFDASGNGWVSESENENLVMYTPTMLAASGSPTPAVRIGSTQPNTRVVHNGGTSRAGTLGNLPPIENLSSPMALAFDTHGNLWVANYGDSRILAYSAAQRTSSGDPIPSIILTGTIDYPIGLAFDRAGNLWVSDDDYYTVSRFDASLLTMTATVAASVVLESDDFGDPQQIAFDDWVVAATPPTVFKSRTHSQHLTTLRTRSSQSRQH